MIKINYNQYYKFWYVFYNKAFVTKPIWINCFSNLMTILWWTFIRQVSTNSGNYQLPLFHCHTLHWRRFLAPGLVRQVFCDVISNSLLTTICKICFVSMSNKRANTEKFSIQKSDQIICPSFISTLTVFWSPTYFILFYRLTWYYTLAWMKFFD